MFNLKKRAQLINYFSRFRLNLELVNGSIILLTTTLVALTFFNALPILNPYITTIYYLSILSLLVFNWNVSPYIIKALLFSIFLVFLSLIFSVFYPNYLNDFYLRGVFICLGIVTISTIKINTKLLRWQALVFAFILVITFIKSFNYYDSFTSTNFISDNVDYTNPNTYAFIALVSILYLDRSALFKNTLFKLIFFGIASISIFNYSSRTSLFCLLAYLSITYILKNYSKISRKFIYLSVVTVAIIFPIVYVSMYESSIANNTNHIIMGKDIYSGRQELWALAKENSNANSIMFGNSNNSLIQMGSKTSDLHNMYISFIYYSGLVYSIILVVFIYYCSVKNDEIYIKTFTYLITLLLLGFLETALIGGGIFAMAALLSFVNYDSSMTNKKTFERAA